MAKLYDLPPVYRATMGILHRNNIYRQNTSNRANSFLNNQFIELCKFSLAAAQHYSFQTSKHAYFPVQLTDLTERRTAMLTALIRFIQEWKRYNQSLSELSRLGDRELADIGISRSDIPRVAWNACAAANSGSDADLFR
jgi:uncharacterized protein YjiS (DUF1127 family)